MRLLFLTLALGLFAIGCTGECESLANIVCDCDPDASQRQACRQQVLNEVRNIQITDADNAICKEKRKTCDTTCGAIGRGDREACGFSKER